MLLLPTATYRAEAFVAAARRLRLDLTVASEQPSSFEAARPEALLTLDFAAPERAATQARAFADRYPIAGVVGVDDDTAVVAGAIREALGLQANPRAALQAARDKYQQRARLAAGAVPVPAFALHHFDDDPVMFSTAFPCVVKPLRLSASRGVIRANDPAELAAAVSRLRDILRAAEAEGICQSKDGFLIEEFVPGVEVAVEGLLVAGRLHVLAVFDKPDPLDGPFFEETIYVTPSRHPPDTVRALTTCVAASAAALGLRNGPVHAELRYDARGPWLIELAARPIGGRCSSVLRFGDGSISLEEIVVRHEVGLPLPSLERERSAAGVMMIPVPRAGTLRAVAGIAEAKAVPGIEDIVITAHPNQALVPWPEGSRYPGFIFARGPEPGRVEAALRAAHRRLRFVLVDDAP